MRMDRSLVSSWVLSLLLLALTSSVRAQPASAISTPHIRVELIAQHARLAPGAASHLALRFVLEKGWHIYWQNPGDSGQAPSVEWTVRVVSDAPTQPQRDVGSQVRFAALRWPAPKRLQTGPIVNFGYEDEAVLLAPVQLAEDLRPSPASRLQITADVRWLVCSEPCLPGRATLTQYISLGEGAGPSDTAPAGQAARFVAAEQALPRPAPSSWQASALLDAQAFHLRLELDATLASVRDLRALFFPTQSGWIDLAAEPAAERAGSIVALRLPRSEQLAQPPSALHGVLQLQGTGLAAASYAVSIPVSSDAAVASVSAAVAAPEPSKHVAESPPVPTPPKRPPSQGLGWMLLFALLGGALLNLMPCVFPVLSIKALELVQIATADPRRARLHGAAYTAGVLVSFWLLAGLLIGLRLMGQQLGWGFHLQSPRFLVALSALLFLMGLNLLGVFELGLRLTQLGQVSADAEQRDGGGLVSAFVTGILATVVATPCTAPFMSTALGFALTQPPLLALPIFTALALGLALPYVLLTWLPVVRRALPRPGAWMETFKQLMGFLLLGTVVWLAWILGAQVGGLGVVALMAGLLLVGVAAWILRRFSESWLGLTTSGLLILSAAIAPAMLPGFQAPPAPSAVAVVATFPAGSAQTPSRGEPPPLVWEAYSKERLAAYRQAGTPVFLDFTAEWCVSCKVNERLVLQSAAVRRRLHERGIVAMKADWTSYDPQITEALAEFGRSAIPFYAVYGRDPQRAPTELPAILTPGLVLSALDKVR